MDRRRPTERGGAPPGRRPPGPPGRAEDRLLSLLREIDGESFPAYRRLLGRHPGEPFAITVDRVPADPFAGPARVRVSIPLATAGLPAALIETPDRRVAVEDRFARLAVRAIEVQFARQRRGAGSGAIAISEPGPAILERSACRIGPNEVELRLFVDLPAKGRRIHGREANTVLRETLPRLAGAVLVLSTQGIEELRRAVEHLEDHRALQAELPRRGWVAFVGNGSLLARAGGGDESPRRDGFEVAFESPPELEAEVDLPHAGKVRGMAIPAGVSLIVGGGFHGKSTLLDAIARGVYPHIRGDGRERVATTPDACVIRSEEGRSVRTVDLSSLVGELPSGVRSEAFGTDKASGSTSQAASLVEAVEVGTRLVLLDEDRSATNFLIRDGRMQRLVSRSAEPIVPFLDRVRELYDVHGISTLFVTGGAGDYLEAADTVIQMNAYRALDVTRKARDIAAQTRSTRLHEDVPAMVLPGDRCPAFAAKVDGDSPLRASFRGGVSIRVGEETIDLRGLDPIVEPAQFRGIALLLRAALEHMGPHVPLAKVLDALEEAMNVGGLDGLDRPVAYDVSRPRRHEIAAALNRWRALRFTPAG